MQVVVQYLEGYKFSAKSDNHTIIIGSSGKIEDPVSPTEVAENSRQESMNPSKVFLASLAACAGVYAVKYCKGANIDTEGLEITVSGQLCEDRPIRFKDIDVKINLKQDIQNRKNALLNFVKNCPVHNTLAHNPNIIFSM